MISKWPRKNHILSITQISSTHTVYYSSDSLSIEHLILLDNIYDTYKISNPSSKTKTFLQLATVIFSNPAQCTYDIGCADRRGHLVRRRDTIIKTGKYLQYIGQYSVQWRDIFRGGYIQYSGGISSVKWRDIFRSSEAIQYSWRISSVLWRISFCYPPQYWCCPSNVVMISSTTVTLMISLHCIEYCRCVDGIPPQYLWYAFTAQKISLKCT